MVSSFVWLEKASTIAAADVSGTACRARRLRV